MDKKNTKKIIISLVTVCLVAILSLSLVACNSYEPKEDSYFDTFRTEYEGEREEGADLRIMSFNALVHIGGWGGTPVAPRAHAFSHALDQYQPDVVGLQEFCKCWPKELFKYEQAKDYKLIEGVYSGSKENRTPIIYNSKTVDLVESGMHIYSEGQKNQCRVVSWGVFKKKDTEEKFAVTSTHWDTSGGEAAGYPRWPNMRVQATEYAEVVNEIKEKHDNLPVISTGDFNVDSISLVDTKEKKPLLRSFSDAAELKLVADDFADISKVFTADVAKPVSSAFGISNLTEFEKLIDHILISDNLEPLSMVILSHDIFAFATEGKYRGVSEVSDHYPVYADIKFK